MWERKNDINHCKEKCFNVARGDMNTKGKNNKKWLYTASWHKLRSTTVLWKILTVKLFIYIAKFMGLRGVHVLTQVTFWPNKPKKVFPSETFISVPFLFGPRKKNNLFAFKLQIFFYVIKTFGNIFFFFVFSSSSSTKKNVLKTLRA